VQEFINTVAFVSRWHRGLRRYNSFSGRTLMRFCVWQAPRIDSLDTSPYLLNQH